MKITSSIRIAFVASLSSFHVEGIQGNINTETFRPHRVSYNDLVASANGGDATATESLLDALRTVGMISITDMPHKAFPECKSTVMGTLNGCMAESTATHEHVFTDGTNRRTMATQTVPGGVQTINHGTKTSTCDEFDQSSALFREAVADVTKLFAKTMTAFVQGHNGEASVKPLLVAEKGYEFSTIADVVDNGEHLEHFHSYHNPKEAGEVEDEEDKTLEWHTDQGLFLVFTPARWTGDSSVVEEGFYVQLQDGTKAQVQFDDEDQLVIMIGDGVNQYLDTPFRATPHALSVPRCADESSRRVWYGRMVLPPFDAMHPTHDVTFGELRRRMNSAVAELEDDQDVLSLGCSSSLEVQHRMLADDDVECTGDTLYCWHRCMDTVEYNATTEICSSQGLDQACVDPRGILAHDSHGDFYPACVDLDTIPEWSDYPPLPEVPDNCTHVTFATHRELSRETFQNELVLADGEASLQWSLIDDPNSPVDGKAFHGNLIYNGLFGWLSIGFIYPGGKHNGMNGGRIILALPGGNYEVEKGLDVSVGTNTYEYVISEDKSSFRHWYEPVSDEPVQATVKETECFTSLEFTISSIHDYTFNFTGTDRLMWAANSEDHFVGYHTGRGLMDVDWVAGTMEVYIPPEDDDVAADDEDSGAGFTVPYTISAAVGALLVATLSM